MKKSRYTYQAKKEITTYSYEKKNYSHNIEYIPKQNYHFNFELYDLPIKEIQDQILQAFNQTNILIILGETGSGKSTQLPKLILNQLLNTNEYKNKYILCTQPRKLNCKLLAERIMTEIAIEINDQKVGDLIGYEISKNWKQNKFSEKTKLKFIIDRLLVNQFQENQQQLFNECYCIIIDEAHERTINTDILVGIIKQFSQQNKQLKIIITSACLNEQLFTSFFKEAIVLKAQNRQFPIEIKYHPFSDRITYIQETLNLLKEITSYKNSQNYKLVQNKYNGHILVFIHGIDEIYYCIKKASKFLNYNKYVLLPLHAKLNVKEQSKALQETYQSQTKIIFTTKIAENSITINGVAIVIDSGYDKEAFYDQNKKLKVIKVEKITKSAAIQRAGRAGRTQPGLCFRLYDEQFYKEQMGDYKLPEIQKMNLDNLVLQLKLFQIQDLIHFDYLEKPNLDMIADSIESLKVYL